MIRAYREYYLEDAMASLGAMLEDAVMLFEVPLERFWPLFLASPLSERFGAGDPYVLAGKSGWELGVQVLEEAGVSFPHRPPDVLRARTPEYWAGWALAQYQWYRGFSFREIETFAPLASVVGLYASHHEMDITRFYDELDRRYRTAHPETRLREFRRRAGLTRDELGARAQVSARLIEQYEQRRRDINAARADSFLSLAKALRCAPAELLERVPPERTQNRRGVQ